MGCKNIMINIKSKEKLTINKVYSDKQFIYDWYASNKNFSKKEFKAEENIIKKNSIPVKDNYVDYYE